jgi:hypothetical protein
MKNGTIDTQQSTRGILHFACVAALGLTLTIAAPRSASAQHVTPPPVPDKLNVDNVEPGNRAFRVGHGVGTQNYVCLPSGAGVAYQLFTPEATLFNDDGRQLITHFFSPNLNPDPGLDPKELGAIRVTWEDSRDTSIVWAKLRAAATHATDPTFVNADAVAWLLLEAVGHQEGPTGGDRFIGTTFIQRLNTVGGLAPSTGCASSADIGTEAFVHYTADYFFFKLEDQ